MLASTARKQATHYWCKSEPFSSKKVIYKYIKDLAYLGFSNANLLVTKKISKSIINELKRKGYDVFNDEYGNLEIDWF